MIAIHVLYGRDDFRRRQAYLALRAQPETPLGPPDTLVFDGREARPEDVLLACRAVPFLGGSRLIVVEGLLSRFEDGGGRGAGRGRRRRDAGNLGGWEAIVREAESLPDTSWLVFLDGDLGAGNPLLQALRPLAAEVREFRPPNTFRSRDEGWSELDEWTAQRAAQEGVDLERAAVQALTNAVGADLWALSTEIEKLAAYAPGRRVTVQDIEATGPGAEGTLYTMRDATVEGRRAEAVARLRELLDAGKPAQLLLAVIAGRYRELLQAWDLQSSGADATTTKGAFARMPDFAFRRLTQQVQRYDLPRLRRAYQRRLETDLDIKSGLLDEETALFLLVHDLSGLPGPPARPPYVRSRSR